MNLIATLKRPRLVAAMACFLLGVAVLGVSLVPWLLAQAHPATPVEAKEPLSLEAGPLDEPVPRADTTPAAEVPSELVVYVTGAVPHPDVYLLPPGARVKDAIVAAGGLGPDAAGERLNLAESLHDAAHIHVPSLVEATVPEPPTAPEAPAAATGLLDLNRASAADLEELPGVGKTIAERIVTRRSDVGPYSAVEDLREVTGIGDKLYSQIAPLVTVIR